MKTKLLTIIAILFTLTTLAQNDLKARIAYEDAETAFAAEDYATAVIHLTEAEKLLGKWTPKVGYLLITSLSKTLDYENPNTKQLETLGKQITHYMYFANNNKDIDMDKFREINAIEKEVNSLITLQKEKNDPDYNLGIGYNEKKDYENALSYYLKAAEKSNSIAMRRIGSIYNYGLLSTGKNYTEAMSWYKKAAEKNNSEAMYGIARMYKYGEGVTQNYTEAMNWYKKAADRGETEAMRSIAGMYNHGESVAQNYTEAMNWYKKAAERGNKSAMVELGSVFRNGRGVTQNYTEAMSWYKKAADKGDDLAMTWLGHLYANGDGVKQNYKEAVSWYEKAANKHNANAMANIAFFYYRGYSVAQDFTESINWYEKALNAGYVVNGFNADILANAYYKTKNYSKAMQWFTKSYELGDSQQKSDAKYNIAKMYEEGLGVPKDRKLAKEWRNK